MEYKDSIEISRDAIRSAYFIRYPLESFKKIKSAITIVNQICEMASGGVAVSEDEMESVFHYILLSTRLPLLYTYKRYLEHFLLELPPDNLMFIKQEDQCCIKRLVEFISELAKNIS